MILKNLKDLFNKGKYQELLKLLEQSEKKYKLSKMTVDEHIECVYFKSRSLEFMGQFENALSIIKEARTKYSNYNENMIYLALIIAEMDPLRRLGRFDESLEISTEGETIINSLSKVEVDKGSYWIALFFNTLGWVYYFKGNLISALEHHKHSLNISESIDNSLVMAKSLNGIAIIHMQKGALDKALEYYQRSLILRESIGNPRDIASVLNNISLVYETKGEVDKALEYLQRSLSLFESIGNPQDIGISLHNIGIIYRQKGEHQTAMDFLQRCLKIDESIGNDLDTSESLFNLILVALDQENHSKAKKYLTQLNTLNNKTPN
ncbi:MAG: tetratricopeptide repeat protein [Candidatus Hodarchaeales archaeon]|jgi:tetratricopeptide (TPR) repeat protein